MDHLIRTRFTDVSCYKHGVQVFIMYFQGFLGKLERKEGGGEQSFKCLLRADTFQGSCILELYGIDSTGKVFLKTNRWEPASVEL